MWKCLKDFSVSLFFCVACIEVKRCSCPWRPAAASYHILDWSWNESTTVGPALSFVNNTANTDILFSLKWQIGPSICTIRFLLKLLNDIALAAPSIPSSNVVACVEVSKLKSTALPYPYTCSKINLYGGYCHNWVIFAPAFNHKLKKFCIYRGFS